MNDTPQPAPTGDETRPLGAQQTIEPDAPGRFAEAPLTPPAPPAAPGGPTPGDYPGPGAPPAGYPAYAGFPGYPPAPRPRFGDQVLGMRSVIAVALVALVIGGLGGALLGALSTNSGGDRFGGPAGFGQRGFGPGGLHQRQQSQQVPQQQLGQSGR
jgi:hypothetical protein